MVLNVFVVVTVVIVFVVIFVHTLSAVVSRSSISLSPLPLLAVPPSSSSSSSSSTLSSGPPLRERRRDADLTAIDELLEDGFSGVLKTPWTRRS